VHPDNLAVSPDHAVVDVEIPDTLDSQIQTRLNEFAVGRMNQTCGQFNGCRRFRVDPIEVVHFPGPLYFICLQVPIQKTHTRDLFCLNQFRAAGHEGTLRLFALVDVGQRTGHTDGFTRFAPEGLPTDMEPPVFS